VQPGSKLEAGSQLKALRRARSRLAVEKKDPMALMRALGQQAAAAKARAGGNSLLATRDLYQCALPSPILAHSHNLDGWACTCLGALGTRLSHECKNRDTQIASVCHLLRYLCQIT
jgi:hypothetical protein